MKECYKRGSIVEVEGDQYHECCHDESIFVLCENAIKANACTGELK